VFEAEIRAPADVTVGPTPGADAPGLGLGPALALPELAREPALPGSDGVGTDAEDGRPGALGTVTVGGAGVETGGVETDGVEIGGVVTGGVVTVPTGVGTVTLGTVTLGTDTEGTDVVGSVTAALEGATASGAAMSRPEMAAEIKRTVRDMVSITLAREKTCANHIARLKDISDPRTRYYRERAPVDRSLPSERASTRR
jgi:hypothetical protein